MRGAVQLRAVLVESCLTFSLILHFLQHTHLLLHLIETRALTYIFAHTHTHTQIKVSLPILTAWLLMCEAL